MPWLGVSWVTALVMSFISTVTVVAAFEYDRWRTESGGRVNLFERVAVQYVITLVLMVGLCLLFHNRTSLGEDTFFSPLHTSVCVGRMCFKEPAKAAKAAAEAAAAAGQSAAAAVTSNAATAVAQ